jgi:adenylate cyclase
VDNDKALADAVAANGTVSLPIFLSDGETGPPETREEKARSQFALSAVQKHGSLRSWSHVTPMIDPLLEATRHAGFANTVIDPDGVTRSAHLYATDGKAVYGQLVMPLFHRLAGVTEVRASPERFVLETRDEAIRIPRRDDGSVLIDWPQKDYDDSFRQIAYTRILDAQELEEDLAFNLREMQRAGYFSYGSTDTTPTQLLESVRSLRNEIRETQNWDLINEYRELKRAYLAVAGRFLNGQALQRMTEEIETRRNQEGVSESERTRLSELEREVESVFAETRKIYDALSKQRSRLQSALADSVVFVGFTATATTDIGVTPFDSTYVNLGIHASLLNTLMTRSFLDYTPRWSAALLAFLAPIGLGVIVRGRRPVHHVIVGLGSIAGLVALAVGVFVVLDIYVPIVGLLAAAGLTLGLLTVVRLLETERDKRWLHGAFEHYISAEFINELIQDPSKLELGGREQELTAMFSDIRRFTRIAEALAPTELVSLLNQYLTNMSDVLLDESATIDKYEGDAIVAFFGAPISLTDHARRACEAALRMKAAEEELNRQVLRDGLSPQPLYTRIGINTGPMVVGNLGTLRRMDYTVMGHQANVAARLETANKLYGTSTLVSESTYRVVSETFIFRRLDRVRFPGLQEPVRLFQLLAHVGEETPILNEALEIFDDGLSAYERGEFAYAEERFEQERRLYPNDGAAMLFEQRCASMRDSDVPEDWDGVTTLESKL